MTIHFRFLYAILFFSFFANSVFGQLQQGDRLLSFESTGFSSALASHFAINDDLASLTTSSDLDGLLVIANPSYGFLLSDNFALGGTLVVAGLLADGGSTVAAIAPYGRYYFVNKQDLALYGGVTGILAVGDDVSFDGSSTASAIAPTAGVSFPVAKNGLLTPELAYVINEGANSLTLAFKLEFILGENTSDGGKSVGAIGKNTWMLGGGLGSFSITGSNPSVNTLVLSPDIHYFLSDRFALGLGIFVNRTAADDISFTTTSFGPNGRFYFSGPKHFMPFIQGGVSFRGVSSNLGFGSDSTTDIDAGIGGNIFLRDRLALELGLNLKIIPDVESAALGFNLGARFLLGNGNQ